MFHINQQHWLEENWRTSVLDQCQVSASNQNVDIGDITTIVASPELISWKLLMPQISVCLVREGACGIVGSLEVGALFS